MRTVLVCVRTSLVAHNVSAMAARLGLSAAVRTAASEPEAMLRLAERACDVVLADTSLARPDPAAFVRRVLARSPGATVLLIGAEERAAAAAAVAAGARGLVQSDPGDLISGVVKAILLLAAPPRSRRPIAPATGAGEGDRRGPGDGDRRGSGQPALGVAEDRERRATDGPGGSGEPPAVVPAQRGDEAGDSPATTDSPGADEPGPARPQAAELLGAEHPRPGVASRADAAAPGAAGHPLGVAGNGLLGAARRLSGPSPTGPLGAPAATGAPATPGVPGPAGAPRPAALGVSGAPTAPGVSTSVGAPDTTGRVTLTEREMQVLIGMAEGKSNAEIGRELFVSEDTVKTHARRLFRKLGARDRAHAVAAGFRAGLVA